MLNAGQNAVVKEILRISAVITTRLPLMADEELIYKDWIIPRRVSSDIGNGLLIGSNVIVPRLTLVRHLLA